MSYILFNDISQWQGTYNMATDPNPAIAIKMGGGDNGLYMDSKANANYDAAVAHGKVPIGYWFAGGTDPIAEAEYFLRCMTPLAENDVYALDWEVQHTDPVTWVNQFVSHIHDKIGVWPLVYMNISTANAYDWAPVFNNCGFWCAAPSFGFDATLPVKYPQVAQQGPIVNGVDTDAFFGTVEELKKYGYHAPKSTAPPTQEIPPVPEPAPAPSPTPDTTPIPTPTSRPMPVPPVDPPTPTPVIVIKPPVVVSSPVHKPSLLERMIAFLKLIFIGRK